MAKKGKEGTQNVIRFARLLSVCGWGLKCNQPEKCNRSDFGLDCGRLNGICMHVTLRLDVIKIKAKTRRATTKPKTFLIFAYSNYL